MIEYILLGVLAPILLNLMHMCVGVYVTVARGSVFWGPLSGEYSSLRSLEGKVTAFSFWNPHSKPHHT